MSMISKKNVLFIVRESVRGVKVKNVIVKLMTPKFVKGLIETDTFFNNLVYGKNYSTDMMPDTLKLAYSCKFNVLRR